MLDQSVKKRNHNHIAVIIILFGFAIMLLLVAFDLLVLKNSVTKRYLIAPVALMIDFLRSEYDNNFAQGKTDFMLVGTSIGFYAFLASWFYLVIFKVFSKQAIYDLRYNSGQSKETLFWTLFKLLLFETVLLVGVYMMFVFALAFLAEVVFK